MARNVVVLLAVILTVGISAQEQDCRGPPPLRINPRECCKQPKLIDDAIFASCFQNYGVQSPQFQQNQQFRQEPPRSGRPFRGGGGPPGFPSTCVAECVFNSTGLSVDQPQRSADFFANSLKGAAPEWGPIFAEGFTFCTKLVAERLNTDDLDQLTAKFSGCSPLPGAILTCLHSHVFTKCPQTMWKNGELLCNNCELIK
ncbi:general odorant-binding protein 67 [Sergentomyia squamirostris]